MTSRAKKAKRAGADTSSATARLRRDAEVVRLGRVLSVQPEALDVLLGADEHTLRELRLAISDHLFELASHGLRNAAKLAGLLPAPVAAKLSEHALGPVLSARTVPLLDPSLVGGIAGRLPAHFLAETAVHLDLRRAGPLIGAVPADKLQAAGTELARRREFVVLAAFVGYMEESVLRSLLVVFDEETLLRAAFLVEEPERIDALVANLDDERVDGLQRAARSHGLWEESLALLSDLGDQQRARFAASMDGLGSEHHAALGEQLRASATLCAAAEPLLDLLQPETRAAIGV